MLFQAILVTLVYYVTYTLQFFGIFHISRPIIVAPLVGLVLGDLTTGIILGATFEAVFLGVIAVGGSAPSDPTIGSVFGTAIAIIGGLNAETALAVAMPISIFGMYLMIVPMNVILPLLVPKAQKYAAAGNYKGVTSMTYLMGFILPIFSAIAVFLGVFLGAEVVSGFLAAMPVWVIKGLGAAGTILPAVGMALLLNMLYDKKVVAFFFLGFVLSIYLGLPSIAIAVIAIVIGLYVFFSTSQKETAPVAAAQGAVQIEEEDFFNG